MAIGSEGIIFDLQFRALPFGLSSAQRILTKTMVEVLAPMKIQGIMIVPYLDDLLFASSKEHLLTDLNRTPLAVLGLPLKQEVKSGSFPIDRVFGLQPRLSSEKEGKDPGSDKTDSDMLASY